jgi:hypothetical protein
VLESFINTFSHFFAHLSLIYYLNTQIHNISCSFNTHSITSTQAMEYSRLKVLTFLFQKIQIFWSLIFSKIQAQYHISENLIAHHFCICFINTRYHKYSSTVYNSEWKFSSNHCGCGIAVRVTYSECVSVALIIRHVKRMRHDILSISVFLILVNISTLSHKWHDFKEKSSRI